jgi:hypothetical protein
MELLIFTAGFFIGLFLWANIIGSIFAALPIRLKMKKEGVIKKVGWIHIVGPLILPAIILTLSAIYLKPFFYGSLIGAVLMLFSISGLRREASENFIREEFSVMSLVKPKIPKKRKK